MGKKMIENLEEEQVTSRKKSKSLSLVLIEERQMNYTIWDLNITRFPCGSMIRILCFF